MRRFAGQVAEGRVEAPDLVLGVTAGRGQQADARMGRARDLQHVEIEGRVTRRGREAAAPSRRSAAGPPGGGHALPRRPPPTGAPPVLRRGPRRARPRGSRRERPPAHALAGPAHAVRACSRARGHDAGEPLALEMERGAVLGRVAGAHALGEHLAVAHAALGLRVEVDAVAPRQQAEALDGLGRAVERRHRLGEPAQRAGAEAAQHDAALPRLAQDHVDAVRLPGAEQADHAAAADVDEVARQQVLANVPDGALAPEQRHVRRLAQLGREGAVEAHDVVIRVAAGRRQEADLGALAGAALAGEAEHVVVEQRVAAFHREAAAAERHDLPGSPRTGRR